MEFKNLLMIKKYKKPLYNVIFLHGFISSHKIFNDIIKNINIKDVNYYAFDYSDNSTTKKPKLIFDKLHEQVISFIEQHNLDNIILIGHSMGGGVVSQVYHHIQEKVKKVILLSPLSRAVLTSKVGITFINGTLFNNVKKLRNTLYSNKNVKNNYDVDELIFEDYHAFLKEKTKHIELGMSLISLTRLRRVMNGYKKITCPTLILLGADDKIIPGKIANEEFKSLKKDNFQILLWQHVGHVTWIENFHEFENIFSDFILDVKAINK